MNRFAAAFFLSLLLPAVPASAAKLRADDRAWVESCVTQRKGNDNVAALRGHCTCMHEVVDDNQAFGITELERSYPPVHQACWKKFRLKAR